VSSVSAVINTINRAAARRRVLTNIIMNSIFIISVKKSVGAGIIKS
jgi:hypothetical protein